MKLRTVICVAVALAGVAPATAHELFLKASTYIQEPHSRQIIGLVNGTFDKSENSVDRSRMADVSIIGGGTKTNPTAESWYDENNTSFLKYETGASGTYVIGVSTKPKELTMPREAFIAYLEHDGILDTLKDFTASSKLAKVTERYSKHVRAITQVGGERTRDYSSELGYPIEIILEKNPYDLRFGDDLPFRVLFRGQPLANQIVRASYEGFHGHDSSGRHISSVDMRTDKDGRASFLLSNKAVWYLTLIHMQKVDEAGLDYESNWATVTFQVK
ncbi:MAG: DUF4198 domain-containing protein [Rhodospirillaceae bacterium]|nr:DUF4198 domain-containing protein [Rhodospirillaceae bacterium]